MQPDQHEGHSVTRFCSIKVEFMMSEIKPKLIEKKWIIDFIFNLLLKNNSVQTFNL